MIDGTKFLAVASRYEGDSWDILKNRIRGNEGETMPFGVILTLPATGSEMNSGYVISRRETNEKLSGGGSGLFPTFSILDPNVVKSLPKNQIVNGIVDAYFHTLEQYMTRPTSADLQERFAESILIKAYKKPLLRCLRRYLTMIRQVILCGAVQWLSMDNYRKVYLPTGQYTLWDTN